MSRETFLARPGHGRLRDLCDPAHPAFRAEYSRLADDLAAAEDAAAAAAVAAAGPGRVLGEWEYVTTARLVADAAALLPRLPPGLDAVLAVSRSGLLPGGLLAAHLHLPLWTVSQSAGVLDPGHGGRLAGRAGAADPRRRVLLVDDTAALGNEMRACLPIAAAAFPGAEVVRAVVYCHPRAVGAVDLYAALYPGEHYLEWNWPNAGHGAACGYDFDGVLCDDCPAEDDDDGPRYRRFLETAAPTRFLPRRTPARLVATARHEKYRGLTERWLARHGVSARRLVMRDFDYDPARRDRQVGRFKAAAALAAGCRMFAESEPGQAAEINRACGLAVLCPGEAKVYPPRPVKPRVPLGARAKG